MSKIVHGRNGEHHWRSASGSYSLCGIAAERIDRDKLHRKQSAESSITCGACIKKRRPPKAQSRESAPDSEADWGGACEVCGQSPVLPATGLCWPCSFGDSSTIGGNW